jgi:hypothetical protein
VKTGKGRGERPFRPLSNFSGYPRRITQLQFEVNGQNYFLAFVEDEHRWYVFQNTAAGINRIPVYVDAPASGKILAKESKPTIRH